MGDKKQREQHEARVKRVIAILSEKNPRLLEKWLADGDRRVGDRRKRRRRT